MSGAEQVRWVDVEPERFAGWVKRFAERHGGAPTVTAEGTLLLLTAPDGERAECHPPPGASLAGSPSGPGLTADGSLADGPTAGSIDSSVDGPTVEPAVDRIDELVAAAGRARRIGLLLVRRGGFAVGVADGPELVQSKVDSRYVQSRTAAGGWSQQRFARRRENQAKAAAGDAAGTCARLLLPEVGRLAALVTGGDRRLVETVLGDQQLAPLRPLVAERFLAVSDPKLAVLRSAVSAARAVRIRIIPASNHLDRD